MRKAILQVLKFIAFLAIGLLVLWVAFRNTDFKKLSEVLKKADYLWLLLSILFGFLAYVARALRWNVLIKPLGYNPSPYSSYHAVLTGYLANLALPRLGEVTRCVALGKKEKIPVDQLIGTVIIERTIDFFTLLLLMTGVLLISSNQVVEFMNESVFLPLREKVLVVFGVSWVIWAALFTLMILGFVFLIKYKKRLRKIRLFAKIFDTAKGVINGLKTITTLERKWTFIFYTVFIWINYALMTWVVVFCIDGTSSISFGESIFLLVIGGLAMSAPVQSGFGVFHYAVSRAVVILKGVSIEDGLAYALLSHESQLIFTVILGTISFYLIFRKKRIM
ncbi:MAG TPA: lysylphosphatidylglycerol synthase transmembrane domain-containing protein [Bacteroidales bacterium]|nr:lysylphosphatidylglycerol synthase transmembrane domain-containing protein [Bacteroidales bacterium]